MRARSSPRVGAASGAAAAAAPPTLLNMSVVRDAAAAGRTAMVIDGVAYDFSAFLKDHPGGPEYLRKNAGKVATVEFVASHPIDIIARTLSGPQLVAMRLGDVDPSTITPADIAAAPAAAGAGTGAGSSASALVHHGGGEKPSLEACINVLDFEAIASSVLSEQAWAYYSSGSDDEITLRENHSAFHRMWLRPRVMVNVKEIDMATTILGHRSAFPIFLSAVAMCKLGHPEGETAWNRACESQGVIYMIPTLSGCSFDEITKSVQPAQPMFFQLYVNQDRAKTQDIVQRAEKAGCSALFITCDAPQLGNREKDRRVKVSHAGAAVQAGAAVSKSEGTAKALTTFIDPSLQWSDIPWFQSITKMKIVLKGIGTAEDAVMALEAGVDGIVLSNHGGRQLDFARSGIEVLPEAMEALRAHKGYNAKKFEVYVDGGIRRGTDVFKALALGAKAVGIGRPALYAMSAFGTAGVERMIQILKAELEMTMRLMGTPRLADIKKSMVIVDHLGAHIAPVPSDSLQHSTYVPAITQAQRNRFGRSAPAEAVGTAAGGAAAAAAPAAVAAGGGYDAATAQVLFEVGRGVCLSFFTSGARMLVHRSSLVLLGFCVVHAGGNLLVLAGPEYFNAYAEHMHHSRFVRAIEVYLLLAGAGHMLSGLFLTWKYNKLALPSGDAPFTTWYSQARLALTGVCVTSFLALHLSHFRFGDSVVAPTHSGARDLYGDVLLVLSQRWVAAFYILAALLVGLHMHYGWDKAVGKFVEQSPASRPLAAHMRVLGSGLALLVTLAFVAAATVAHLRGVGVGV